MTLAPDPGPSLRQADRRDVPLLRQLRVLLQRRSATPEQLFTVGPERNDAIDAVSLLEDTGMIALQRGRFRLTGEGRLFIATRTPPI